jgi:hypothetical protein
MRGGETRLIMTTGRERPVSETPSLGSTLVTDNPVDTLPPVANIVLLGELKERIRAVLMTRIDPSVAGRIPRARLRGEVAQLVSEIANEDRAQLNKIEEATPTSATT